MLNSRHRGSRASDAASIFAVPWRIVLVGAALSLTSACAAPAHVPETSLDALFVAEGYAPADCSDSGGPVGASVSEVPCWTTNPGVGFDATVASVQRAVLEWDPGLAPFRSTCVGDIDQHTRICVDQFQSQGDDSRVVIQVFEWLDSISADARPVFVTRFSVSSVEGT